MRYEEFSPNLDLRTIVHNMWMFALEPDDVSEIEHIVVPDGLVSLNCVILPNGQLITGTSCPSPVAFVTKISNGATYMGIRLQPGAAGSLLQQNVQDLIGTPMTPLNTCLPEMARFVDDRLGSALDQCEIPVLLSEWADLLAPRSADIDIAVHDFGKAIMACNGHCSLTDIAQSSPLSQRQLRRRFTYEVGLTPKEFARLRRIRHACTDLVMTHGKMLNATSIETGFSDQAHMSREFRQIFGKSSRMVLSYLRQIQHVGVQH